MKVEVNQGVFICVSSASEGKYFSAREAATGVSISFLIGFGGSSENSVRYEEMLRSAIGKFLKRPEKLTSTERPRLELMSRQVMVIVLVGKRVAARS